MTRFAKRSVSGWMPARRAALAASVSVALLAPALSQDHPERGGVLKICKVAGANVAIGEQFTFEIDSTDSGSNEFVTLRAGRGPSGNCFLLMREVAPGSTAVITEQDITPTDAGVVGPILVEPAGRGISQNVANETATVAVGPGVTEVTFTNARGYFEICKGGAVEGDFTFTVEGVATPVVVPAGACSPAILAPAGVVTVTETAGADMSMTGCDTFPADRLEACSLANRTAEIEVVPGDISTQTILFVENNGIAGPAESTGVEAPALKKPGSAPKAPKKKAGLGAARDYALLDLAVGADAEAAATRVVCAPRLSASGALAMCSARVTAASPDAPTPTGMVKFVSGQQTIALLPLKPDGTATLALPAAMASGASIVAAYAGAALSSPPPAPAPSAIRLYRPGEPAPDDSNAAVLNAIEMKRTEMEPR